MKKSVFLSIALCLAIALSSFGVFAVGESDTIPEIPYSTEKVSGVIGYWYGNLNYMTEADAAAAGLPEGYSGDVLELVSSGAGNVGIALDVSEYKLKVNDIESVTFRIICPEGSKEFRITDNAGKDWIVRVVPEKTGEWMDVTVTRDGGNIFADKSFNDFADEEGYFKVVNVGIRFVDGADRSDKSFYIDSVTFNMREKDTEAPVIEYDGETDIITSAEKVFKIDATAYDEYDKANIIPEYIFSEGAIDESGALLEGEHTCTVRFTDLSGNYSEIVLNLTVNPRDVNAPVFDWAPVKIFAEKGSIPVLSLSATDDVDGKVDVVATWSEGAISWGRLTVGEHTLTLTAVDATGNVAERVIPVVVVAEIPSNN